MGRNFGQNSEFLAKMEILVENGNFGRKLKFGSKIELLVENRNLGKIEILLKNRNFGQRSKFWSELRIFHIKKSRSWANMPLDHPYLTWASAFIPRGTLTLGNIF